jgi:hypothetical protein
MRWTARPQLGLDESDVGEFDGDDDLPGLGAGPAT